MAIPKTATRPASGFESEGITGQPGLLVEKRLACDYGSDGLEKGDYGQGEGQRSGLVGALRDDQGRGAEDHQDVDLPTGEQCPKMVCDSS